jgi:hypothetical protein
VLLDVVTVRIEQRNRIRPELERVMLECDLRAEPARCLVEDRDLEITVRSSVVGEHVDGHHRPIVPPVTKHAAREPEPEP